ncbi:amidohydrolase family protein [Erythrobacter sp.]|uniref:amidohydrolase family protein n=1 Tax=Erythrobacter sp. TaxID=1042 RepID=UPI003C71EF39
MTFVSKTRVAIAALAIAIAPAALAQDVAVRGDTLYTMADAPISDGVVVIENGVITAVGPVATTPIPEGMRVLAAPVVTPGLIDAHSTVGLAGYLNQSSDQDQLENSEPIQPQLRAIDAYNPREKLVEWVRELGVTTLHTGHGPGALVSGQTMVVKTTGDTVEDALLVDRAMIAANLGSMAYGDEGAAPGTRSKQIAMLRAALVAAQNGTAPDSDEDDEDENADATRDLANEVMQDVLARRVPLMVTAWRERDILNALRLAREFDIDVVIDGAAEAYLVTDELREAGVPVILHPPRARQYGDLENASFTTAATLRDAGIPFAFQSGYEGYVPKTRVVLWEAAVAAANGLGMEGALRAITIDAARLIGVDDRVGSLEVGKHGDVAMFEGDPFETTNRTTGVVIEGVVVSDQPR